MRQKSWSPRFLPEWSPDFGGNWGCFTTLVRPMHKRQQEEAEQKKKLEMERLTILKIVDTNNLRNWSQNWVGHFLWNSWISEWEYPKTLSTASTCTGTSKTTLWGGGGTFLELCLPRIFRFQSQSYHKIMMEMLHTITFRTLSGSDGIWWRTRRKKSSIWTTLLRISYQHRKLCMFHGGTCTRKILWTSSKSICRIRLKAN